MMRTIFIAFGLVVGLTLGGCQQNNSAARIKPPPPSAGDHDMDHGALNAHGPPLSLGSAIVDGWNLLVTRDEGELKAGGEAAIDCEVTGGAGKVSAVRFWIGTEDAKGALKALAAIENPDEPNRWHTHAEIPNPIGEDSKLWVELEDSTGAKHVSGFDLKK